MTTNPIKALVTESGKEAVPVNPFDMDIRIKEFKEFAAAHPKRELVTPRPDLANSVQEVKVVYQGRETKDEEWYEISESQYMRADEPRYTRIAYQVEAVKEEKPKVEFCDKCDYVLVPTFDGDKNICNCNRKSTTPIVQGSEESVEAKAIKYGWNVGYQQRNDEVVAIIEDRIKVRQQCPELYKQQIIALTDLLTTITKKP